MTLAAPHMLQRGVVHVDAHAKSLFTRWFETLWTILLRESGF